MLTYDLSIALLDIYPRTMKIYVDTNIYIWFIFLCIIYILFIVLFINSQNLNQNVHQQETR